jgi:hypothetical protein
MDTDHHHAMTKDKANDLITACIGAARAISERYQAKGYWNPKGASRKGLRVTHRKLPKKR